MQDATYKTIQNIDACTYRRLNIEHEINANIRERKHLSNLQFYKHRERLFKQKLANIRKTVEKIKPYGSDEEDDDNEQALMIPNGFARIQNHFHLLKFSSESERRLLCTAPSYKNSKKQTSNHLPAIVQKSNSTEIKQCLQRIALYQSRLPVHYSCRSKQNNHFANLDSLYKTSFKSYLHQQIIDEHIAQIEMNERKSRFLKSLDELKHTTNDPHSTLSVLAALSRAVLFLDSAIK